MIENPLAHPIAMKAEELFDDTTLAKTLRLLANVSQGPAAAKIVLRFAASRIEANSARIAKLTRGGAPQ